MLRVPGGTTEFRNSVVGLGKPDVDPALKARKKPEVFMPRLTARFLVPLILCGALASAQNPNAARDAELIASAKQVSVHNLDDALPDLDFEKWLAKQSGPEARYHWEVNDCGEQSGNPNETGPVPLCVEVDSTLKDGREIVIMIADDSPETSSKTTPPDWKIFFAQLTTAHEKINLRRLSDLPAALIKTQNHPETGP
jgi:hypothetical protein